MKKKIRGEEKDQIKHVIKVALLLYITLKTKYLSIFYDQMK